MKLCVWIIGLVVTLSVGCAKSDDDPRVADLEYEVYDENGRVQRNAKNINLAAQGLHGVNQRLDQIETDPTGLPVPQYRRQSTICFTPAINGIPIVPEYFVRHPGQAREALIPATWNGREIYESIPVQREPPPGVDPFLQGIPGGQQFQQHGGGVPQLSSREIIIRSLAGELHNRLGLTLSPMRPEGLPSGEWKIMQRHDALGEGTLVIYRDQREQNPVVYYRFEPSRGL